MRLDDITGNIGAHVQEAVVIADADPRDGARLVLRWINPAFCRLTGYAGHEVIGKTAGVLTGENTDPAAHQMTIDRLSAWETFAADLRCHKRDGSSFWAQLHFKPMSDRRGVWRYWIMTFRDISALYEMEIERSDLARISQATSDMVISLDRQRRVTWVNRAVNAVTGYDIDDLRGRRLTEILPADTADQTEIERLLARLDQRRPAKAEIVSRRKDGRRFLAAYDYQPIYAPDGSFRKYVVLLRDITQRWSLETRYKAVFDETLASVAITDGDTYVMVNRGYAAHFGKSAADMVGLSRRIFLSDDDLREKEAVEETVLASGDSVVWDSLRAAQDGALRHNMVKTFRIFDPLGDRNLICSIATDVTQIRETEKALQRSQQAASEAHERLWAAIKGFPDGFVIYDQDDRVLHSNAAFRRMHGPLADEISPGLSYQELITAAVERNVFDLEGQDPADWLADHLARRMDDNAEDTFLRMADGTWYLCRELTLENGERAGIRIDATRVKQTEHALGCARAAAEQAEERLMAAIDALDSGFMIYDAEDRLVVSNMFNLNMSEEGPQDVEYGETFEQMLRRAVKSGIQALPEGMMDAEAYIASRMARHRDPQGPIISKLTDGRIFRIVERKTKRGDTVTLRTDLTRERTQQMALEKYAEELEHSKRLLEDQNEKLHRVQLELRHTSRHDALTGLANRRYFEEMIAAGGAGQDGAPWQALFHVDLDRFKAVNDMYGHAAGDAVLRNTAAILRAEVPGGGFVARVGGDEFVILLREGGSADDLSDLAERIVRRLAEPMRAEGQRCRIGGSIGIAMRSSATESGEELLKRADVALYEAKTAGRNRHRIYSESTAEASRVARALSDDLLRAIDEDRFDVLFQPIVHAPTGGLTGVEAVLRWDHPTRGQLSPHDFLAIARDLDVMSQLDQIALTRAVAADRALQASGITLPCISVNVSGARLRDPSLIDDIRATGIEPSRLIVEIVETVFMDQEEPMLRWSLDQLRELGVTVALDDFGTGHSSIIALLQIKPGRLKIDKSFVDQALGVDGAEKLISSVIDIGASLGVEVVSEGIETIDQAERLGELGCTLMQGYVFGAPMTVGALSEFAARARFGGARARRG